MKLSALILLLSSLPCFAQSFHVCIDEKTKQKVFQDAPCYGMKHVRRSSEVSQEELAKEREADRRFRTDLVEKDQRQQADDETERLVAKARRERDNGRQIAQADPRPAAPSRIDRDLRQTECQKLIQNSKSSAMKRAYGDLCAKGLDEDSFSRCKGMIQNSRKPAEIAAGVAACTGDSDAMARIDPPKQPPSPVESSPIMTQCDGSGCWDTKGQRYNAAGGNTLFRSDGKACYKTGDRFYCN